MSGQGTFERVGQKQRTRAQLLAAARDVLKEGRQPTVAEAADRAAVSRATAYRYFSTPEAMIQEAVLDANAAAFEGLSPGALPAEGDLADRAEAVVAAILRMVLANEALFRTYLGAAAAAGPGQRGGRRMGWIRAALAPLADQLSAEQMELLILSLSLAGGIETVVVLGDVCGVAPADMEDRVRQIARLMVRGVLAEA